MSWFMKRRQPDEAFLPIELHSGVPCSRYIVSWPSRNRYMARAPSGFCGPGGMPSAYLASSGLRWIISAGGVHVGHFFFHCTTALPVQPKPALPRLTP